MAQLWRFFFVLFVVGVAVRLDDDLAHAEDPAQAEAEGSGSASATESEEEPVAKTPVPEAKDPDAEDQVCDTCAGGCIQGGICYWSHPITGGVLDDVVCNERGGRWCPGTGSICVTNGCAGNACWIFGKCEKETESLTQDVCDDNGGTWCEAGAHYARSDTEVAISDFGKDHAARGHDPVAHRDIAGEMAARELANDGSLAGATKVASDTAVYLAKFEGKDAATQTSLARDAASAARDTVLSHGGSKDDAEEAAQAALDVRAKLALGKWKDKNMAQLVEDADNKALSAEQARVAEANKNCGCGDVLQTVNMAGISHMAAIKAADMVVALGGVPCEVKRAARAASTKAMGGVPAEKDIAGEVKTDSTDDMKVLLTKVVVGDKYERKLEMEKKFGLDEGLPRVYGQGARMPAVLPDFRETVAKQAGEDAAQEAINAGKSKEQVAEIVRQAVRSAQGSKQMGALSAGEAAVKTARANGEDPGQIQKAASAATIAAGGSEADAAEVVRASSEPAEEDDKWNGFDLPWGRATTDRESLPLLRRKYKAYLGPLPPAEEGHHDTEAKLRDVEAALSVPADGWTERR